MSDKKAPQFPIVDALLELPKEGENGKIAICTNAVTAGQVLNEIEQPLRADICALGNLIVSRDGAERMIINSLAHPTLRFLVLFGEESLTFSPCTNLLQAVMYGIDENNSNNIQNGIARSGHYPNLNDRILSAFKENIIVLPLHTHKHKSSDPIVDNYLTWLSKQGIVGDELIEMMRKVNKKGKAYYDVLNDFLRTLSQEAKTSEDKQTVELDPQDFQQLQPPKREVTTKYQKQDAPFEVSIEDGKVSVKLALNNEVYEVKNAIREWDALVSIVEGLLTHSTNSKHGATQDTGVADGACAVPVSKSAGDNNYDLKELLTPIQQLCLGYEIARCYIELNSDIKIESIVNSPKNLKTTIELPITEPGALDVDDEYYYKLMIKDDTISVLAMAQDICEQVFDLRGDDGLEILAEIAELNRFKSYKYDILHRGDIGSQLALVNIAYQNDLSYIQDFYTLFKVNKEKLPFLKIESDTFLDAHLRLIQSLFTNGVEEMHADVRKGMARSGICLVTYRQAATALENMVQLYAQGDKTTEEIRRDYKEQLLRFDHDGDYSYGHRTRTHFGVDQLEVVEKALKESPTKVALTTRYDPVEDMSIIIDEETNAKSYTHDPCLVNDIYFINDGKLHGFFIARAHNTVNAYPENIYGLFDAYFTPLAKKLGLEIGDMYMLSNRANILILTEDQRAKTIIREPRKPNSHNYTTESGLFNLDSKKSIDSQQSAPAVEYSVIESIESSPDNIENNRYVKMVESYDGIGAEDSPVDTIAKACEYLNDKGLAHNNPVLTGYRPNKDAANDDHLAFFQANVFAGKIYSTAVFINSADRTEAMAAANHIAHKHQQLLKTPHGELHVFFIG